MTPAELGQQIKLKNPGTYDQYPDEVVGQRTLIKYPQYQAAMNPDPEKDSFNFERDSNYPPSRMTDVTPSDALIVDAAVKAPAMAYNLGRAGISGIKALAGKIGSIYNAPSALEDALGTTAAKFGTTETPSMVGNTARAGLETGEAENNALAQKLYGQVTKDYPVSTPKLSSTYQEISDELPPGLKSAVEKHVQLESNPVRPNDVGTTNTKIMGVTMPDKTPIIPHQYSASPGTPSQLPPNNPSVGDLITLRSKLGAVARNGGIDGFNAGRLKAALDSDIANIGADEGPLGKMANDVTNAPLKRATNYYSQLMEQQSNPLYKKLATGKIEDIPDIIFKKGNTQDVLAAKAYLGDEGFNAAKKSFFNDLINSKDVGKILTKYGQSNSDFLGTAFNPDEVNALQTVAGLQHKAIEAAKTVERAKMLMTGVGAAVVGGGVAGKAIKFGMDSR